MTSKQFVITVTARYEDRHYLNVDNVQDTITSVLGYGIDTPGYGRDIWWISSVEDFTTSVVRDSKLTAIKRVRTLLDCGLIDAKNMTDAAKALGEFQFMGLTVSYDTGSDCYRVTDNRRLTATP